MAPGVSKTKWHGNGSSFQPETPSTPPDVNLCYEGKRDEAEILSTHPALTRPIWGDEHARNHLYYGDNLPILAQFLQNPSLRGKVRLVYIDPPFATKSVFKSRSQRDAYQDLLAGAHYIEFLRQRLIFPRELLADDGSIYVHLDENMAFYIKVIMDEIFEKSNFRNWITRKKSNPKNYTRKTYGNISDYILILYEIRPLCLESPGSTVDGRGGTTRIPVHRRNDRTPVQKGSAARSRRAPRRNRQTVAWYVAATR